MPERWQTSCPVWQAQVSEAIKCFEDLRAAGGVNPQRFARSGVPATRQFHAEICWGDGPSPEGSRGWPGIPSNLGRPLQR